MTTMPFARVWRAYLMEIRCELLRVARSPAFVAPFLLAPVALYLLFAVVIIGSSERQPPPWYLFTGFATFGIMGPGLFGFGISLATEREQGLLTLRRALPMPPIAHLLAKMAMAMLFSALVMTSMIVAALAASPLALSVAQMLGLLATGALGTLPFCAIGMFVGMRVSGRAAPAVLNLLYLPMIYLSSILIPLPRHMAAISVASPAFHLNQLSVGVTGGPMVMGVAMHIAVLAGITVLCAGLTARRLTHVG